MLLAMLIAFALSRQSAPDVAFEVDLWPGEGRPVFEAMTRQLQLREHPSESSRFVDTLRVQPRQRLTFDETRYRTTKPGRFVVLTSSTITGRALGDIRRLSRSDYYSGKFGRASVTVKAGDLIQYLQYRVEGTCFVRSAGSIMDADPCPTVKRTEFRLEAKPLTEWWIHLAVDWTNTLVGFDLCPSASDTQVRFSPRGCPEANGHYRTSCHCWALYLRVLRRYLGFGETVPYDRRLDV